MQIQTKTVGCGGQSGLAAVPAPNLSERAERSFKPLPSAIDGASTYPSSRRIAKLLRLLAVWLGVMTVMPALSPINQALAADEQEAKDWPGRVTAWGFRPPPLDYFNSDYNSVDSSITAAFSSSYVRLPISSVPAGNKSAAVPEQVGCEGSDGGPKPPPETAGNPVVLFNGNKIELEVDFVSNGEAGLHLQRLYNHYWAGVGIFGKHWISNFDLKLTFGNNGFTYTNGVATGVDSCYPRPGGSACGIGVKTSIYAHRPDGKIYVYYLDSADGIFYGAKRKSRIVRQANGGFVLYGEAGQAETYSSAGYVSSVKNAQGIGWVYTYTSGTYPSRVTHTSGRYVEFTWTGGQLTAVRDPAGNYYGYSYAANQFGTGLHRLASTSQPGNPVTTTTYHYELTNNAKALTGKSFNGVRYSTFSYNGGGGAVSQTTHNGVETWNFSYEDLNGLPGAEGIFITTYVNPLGKTTKNVYSYGKLWKVSGVASANCPSTVVETTYNTTSGYPELVLDANGNGTVFTYDAKGQLLSQIEAFDTPLARTTQYQWDATRSRMVSVTVVGVSKTSYTYTADNRIASVTQTNLLAPSPATNLNQARITTYTYTKHANGMLATVTENGPLPGSGDAVTQSFNAAGDLISVSNSLGHATTYANHNGRGQPGRVTGPNGAITDYTYDGRGRITAQKNTVNGAVQTTTYTYDGAGNLASVQRPDGQKRIYVYDAARRLLREYEQESTGVFAQKRYTYNNLSQVTRVDTERTTSPVAAPSISVTPATSSNGSYTVDWSNVGDTTSYRLVQSINGGTWTLVQATAATIRDFSGKANGTYSYRVNACNATGCGPTSATVSVVVSLAAPPVAAPSISVTPTTSSNGSYTVAWGGVGDTTSYRLSESVNGGTWTLIQSTSATSRAISGKANGTYSYRVNACNAAGCGPTSGTVNVVVSLPAPLPAVPVMTAPSGSTVSGSSYSAAWGAVTGATSYRLEEQRNTLGWNEVYNGSSTSKMFTKTNSMTANFSYRVRACNAQGCSAYSAVRTISVEGEGGSCGPGTGEICP